MWSTCGPHVVLTIWAMSWKALGSMLDQVVLEMPHWRNWILAVGATGGMVVGANPYSQNVKGSIPASSQKIGLIKFKF